MSIHLRSGVLVLALVCQAGFLSGCTNSRLMVPAKAGATIVPTLTAAEKSDLKAGITSGHPITPDQAISPSPTPSAAPSAGPGSSAELLTPNAAAVSDCSDFRAKLPAEYVQDFVEVPEDWSNPAGLKIHVFYYGAKPDPAKTSVVFFNGGPGASSHSSYDVLESGDPVKLGAKLSFVFIDQRGTGCSDPYPSTYTAETVQRLTHYSSRSIVKDAEAVRAKMLGADGKWEAFGQSYGGYIVHRYLEVAPDHLLGAFAHGSSINDDWTEWLRLRILSQYRVSQDYFAQYPGDQKTLDIARGLVPATRCFTDDTATLCGPAVFDAATILMGFHDDWSTLHGWINRLVSMSEATPRLYEDILMGWVKNFVFGEYDDNGLLAGVIGAVEMSNPGMISSPAQCQVVTTELQNAGLSPQDWTINECRLLAGMTTPFDNLVNSITAMDPFSIADIQSALSKSPSLPFFLYSGQEDVFVPVETFAKEVSTLGSRIHYTNFMKTGHDGFFTEPQVWSDLSR